MQGGIFIKRKEIDEEEINRLVIAELGMMENRIIKGFGDASGKIVLIGELSRLKKKFLSKNTKK